MKQWQHLPITALTHPMRLCLFIGFCLLTGSLLNSGTVHARSSTTLITNCKNDRQLQAAVSTAPSGATIVFRCSGDIPLSKTLTITKKLTLDGNGQLVTLDGHGSVRGLVVNSGVTFTLKTLTIARGSSTGAGGGLLNSGGTVTISNSTISSSTALAGGGIFNAGTMIISGSTIANNTATSNGGGLTNATAGKVTISDSTISSNTSFAGGGAFNSGSMAFSKSLIANNTATGNGGGLTNTTAGKVTISDSTISSNTSFADGGAFNAGTMTISNSDFTDNMTTVAATPLTGHITVAHIDPDSYVLDPRIFAFFKGLNDPA